MHSPSRRMQSLIHRMDADAQVQDLGFLNGSCGLEVLVNACTLYCVNVIYMFRYIRAYVTVLY